MCCAALEASLGHFPRSVLICLGSSRFFKKKSIFALFQWVNLDLFKIEICGYRSYRAPHVFSFLDSTDLILKKALKRDTLTTFSCTFFLQFQLVGKCDDLEMFFTLHGHSSWINTNGFFQCW